MNPANAARPERSLKLDFYYDEDDACTKMRQSIRKREGRESEEEEDTGALRRSWLSSLPGR
jgi:hypothetical protein